MANLSMKMMMMPPPSRLWKTGPAVLQKVTELRLRPPSRDVLPRPASGRSFMELTQKVRFMVYHHLLYSEDPIIRPWPSKKFAVQLLRVNKDIFAEAAYCFYGMGDDGEDFFDDDMDVSMNDSWYIYEDDVSGRALPNTFQPMMRFDTAHLVSPPQPYRFLVRKLHLSYDTKWNENTLGDLLQYANLEEVSIGLGTIKEHFSFEGQDYHSQQDFLQRHYKNRALEQDADGGSLIKRCVLRFVKEDHRAVSILVRQTVLEPAPEYEAWWQDPDFVDEIIGYEATVDVASNLDLLADNMFDRSGRESERLR